MSEAHISQPLLTLFRIRDFSENTPQISVMQHHKYKNVYGRQTSMHIRIK